MKILKKVLLGMMTILLIGGCSCSKECNCPDDENKDVVEEYKTIVNDYSSLYKDTVKSVVMIRVQRKNNKSTVIAKGSGFVAYEENDNAYIYTNAHVIKGLTNDYEIEVIFSDEKGFPSGESEIAAVMGKDFKEDVAVLKINKSEKYKLAIIGDSSNIERGDFAYTIGSPLDKFNYTTSGNISSYNVKIELDSSNTGTKTNVYAIMFDADINEGNSGGALFDGEGKIIGVTTLRFNDSNGMYAALPINYFEKVAKYLVANGTAYLRPSLSLNLMSINEMGSRRDEMNITDYVTTGVYVLQSYESAIAGQTVITEVNGVEVKSEQEFWVEILKYNINNTVTLTLINRDGLNVRTVDVVLHV